MACTTRWGGGGNESGDWVSELTTREELETQGWAEYVTGLSTRHIGDTEPSVEYVVFSRDCVAGEIFTYRTEKYAPPTIIRSVVTVPEPSLFALLVMGGVALLALSRRR